MSTYEQRQRERSEYLGDVAYETWRMGGNPDHIDHDAVTEGFYCGIEADSMARMQLRHHCEQYQRQAEEYEPEEEIDDRTDKEINQQLQETAP